MPALYPRACAFGEAVDTGALPVGAPAARRVARGRCRKPWPTRLFGSHTWLGCWKTGRSGTGSRGGVLPRLLARRRPSAPAPLPLARCENSGAVAPALNGGPPKPNQLTNAYPCVLTRLEQTKARDTNRHIAATWLAVLVLVLVRVLVPVRVLGTSTSTSRTLGHPLPRRLKGAELRSTDPSTCIRLVLSLGSRAELPTTSFCEAKSPLRWRAKETVTSWLSVRCTRP